MIKFFTIAFVFTILQYSSVGQEFIFKGRVADESNLPIQNAIVKILVNDSVGIIKYFSLSKSDGTFQIFLNQINHKFLLQISSIGYIDYLQNFSFSSTDASKTYVLKKFIGDLPAVKVVANKSITRKGDTTTFKVSLFETGNESSLADLLRKLPGLFVDEKGKVNFNGKRISRILLEEDDLFGSNYAALTNNAGISGIEEIDVIENYKDNSRLENKTEFGNETVLNLKYKKKKVRFFGNNSIATDFPLEFNEFKNSLVGLLNKQKLVFNINKNSIGFLSNNIFGSGSEMQLLNNENEKIPTNINLYYPPIQFTDNKPLNIKDDRVFTNNSLLLSINHLFKINKKIAVKTIANILGDNYSQKNTSIQTIINPVFPIIIQQSNTTNKNNSLTNFETELNWKPSNFFQTIVQYSYNNLYYNQLRNGQFFSKLMVQELLQTTFQHRAHLLITKLTKKGGVLSGSVFYNNFNLANSYIIENPLLDTSLQLPSTFNYLQQSVISKSNIWATQLKYSVKKNGYAFTYLFQLSKEKSNLIIGTNAFNFKDSIFPLAKNYNSEFHLVSQKQSFSLSISKNYTQKLQLSTVFQLLNAQLARTETEQINISSKKKVFLNPSVNLQYKLNNKKVLFFNFQIQPVFPLIQHLQTSYVFTGVNSTVRGVDTFNINNGYNLSVGYLFFDALNSGIVFNTFCLVSNSPPNYLTNLSTNGSFVYNQLFAFNKKNSFITLSTRLEKNFYKIKSTIITNINITNSQSFFSSYNQLTLNKGNVFQFELKYRTNWNKWFNLTNYMILRNQVQKSTIQNTKVNQFSNTNFVVGSSVSLRLYKKWFIDVQNDYIFNKPNTEKRESLWFADVQGKYNISKRVTIGVLFKNLFNKKDFISNEISTTQNVYNVFNLQPFFALLNLQYKF